MTRTTRTAVLATVLALLYTGIGIPNPSFWVDEAATISAIDRSFPDLIRMLGNIDAVHGFYYVLMHGWTSVFGMSELSMRLPSLLAVAATAGLIAAIGGRIGNPVYGLVAALLFVLLPRAQYVGTDARSYALALVATVAATYCLVRLRERVERRFWVGYAVAGLLATLLSFYTVLVLFSHAVTVLLDGRLRARWGGLLAVSPAWIAPAASIGVLGAHQQFQIAWIRPIDGGVVGEVALLQFFSDAYFMLDGEITPRPTPLESLSMVGLAVLLWGLVFVGAFRFRRHFVVSLALPLLVLPLAAVIGGSVVLGSPYYLPRYVSFILPTVPLLAATVALRATDSPARNRGRVPPRHVARWLPLVLVTVAAVLAVPSYLGQRSDYGRSPDDDFRFVARTIGENARDGDAFALTVDSGLSHIAYGDSFTGLVDVTVGISAAEWGRIYDQRFDLDASKDRILVHDVVWLAHTTADATQAQTLKSLGYREDQRFVGTGHAVVKFVREDAPSP